MGSHHEETTDDTSIRPVSSLRSHFERIAHHHRPAQAPQQSHPPDTVIQVRPHDTGTRLSERSSLDTPRTRPPTLHSSVPVPQGHRQDAVHPTWPATHPLAADSPPQTQSILSHPLVPQSYNPPLVTIQSPTSPHRATGDAKGSPAMVGHEGKAKAKTGHGQVLRPSDFTVAPSPNRASKPILEPQSDSGPGCPTVVSGSRLNSPMSPIASHRSTTRDTQLQLEADGSTIDDRISPFSTPPSSDDSLNANASGETSPVKVQELPSPAQDVNGSKPARSPCPPGPSKTRGTPLLRREQSPLINATSKHHFGTHERRPDLPPRPEITARYSSPQAQHALGSTSTNVLGGKNTPVASPKPMNTTLPDEQQLYRPYRSSVPPSPGLAPPQLPTRMVVSRKSTPNQPLPTDVLPSDPSSRRGLEEMTANSLSPGIRPPVSGSPDNEFPDGSASNRRPPCIITGCHVIHANYDSKVFDMCAGRACSAGQLTRVWDLASGKMLLSLALGEREVRATAIAFKPAAKIDEEGSRLWVGTSYGNVHEVDIMSHRVVSSGLSPHSGREVVRIHRYQNTMWTLDEDGTLHCWPPDDSGLPTLDSKPVTWKVPRGHSFSMVIRGLLWIAAGREIQIFRPSGNNDRGEFKLAQQPPSQRGVGEITSGAVIGGQLDKVYFSHSDGRVTVYSVVDYACLGVVNASVYKINCLTGAGTHLWAGYNTGKICVYDTKVQPWKIVKEWHAHEGPVANMMVDRTGLWMSGVLRVGSVSLDNSMKMWDGLLEEDWLESQMQDNDTTWCSFREIEAVVMTWNAGASTPASLRYEQKQRNMLQVLLQPGKAPDLLVFGFQELVDLGDKKMTAKTLFKGNKRKDVNDQEHMSRQYRDWRDYLVRSVEDFMPTNESYTLLHTASMVGLFSCVFVKASQRPSISNVEAAEIKRGMGGLHGNKGALILRFSFEDTSVCLVNCHLAAGQTQTLHRNNDVAAILESFPFHPDRESTTCGSSFVGGGDGSMILDHQICILNGDLNYRIDTMSRDTVIKAIHTRNLEKLLERDQLLVSRRKNPTFGLKAFAELPIDFEPTYKYDVGTDTYDSSEKHRAPAWCDRILYRGPGKIKQLDYLRHELRVSDHRPVSGTFRIRVRSVVPSKREKAWQDRQEEFAVVRSKVERETKVQYLRDVLGLAVEEAWRLIDTQSN